MEITNQERTKLTRTFRKMLKGLEQVRNLMKSKYTLHKLHNEPLGNRIEEFELKTAYGISEFYWYGQPSCIDWIIGIEIFNKQPRYVYEKLYIFGRDDIQKFRNKGDFIKFLEEKGLIATSHTQATSDEVVA